MKYAQLFGKTQRNASQQFESKNHELLTKAGYIDQTASGIYTFLPLGKRVLDKIITIVREEMNEIGSQELTMPGLQPKTLWQQTERWDTVDVLFKVKSRYDQEYGLAPIAEDVITSLVKKNVQSYKDL